MATEADNGSFTWRRDGENITYKQSDFKRESGHGNYYTLSFTCELEPNRKVYIAYCYPYTYTELNTYLNKIC